MENYTSPKIEVCALGATDVIVTSIVYDSNETEEDFVFFTV